MKDILTKLWQNKKVVGFVGVVLTAAGGYLSGQIDQHAALLLILGYLFPSPWPTAPEKK